MPMSQIDSPTGGPTLDNVLRMWRLLLLNRVREIQRLESRGQ
jgi:hypothetical protein